MKATRIAVAAAATAGLAALALSACGERPQIVQYEQGKYQGKADTRPWESPAFKGDKAAWEAALANRNQAQNEYKRVP